MQGVIEREQAGVHLPEKTVDWMRDSGIIARSPAGTNVSSSVAAAAFF